MGFQIGKTKVFLRAGQLAELDSYRNQILGKSASKIQRKFRSHFARKNFLSLRKAAIQTQAVCRGIISVQWIFIIVYRFCSMAYLVLMSF